MINARVTAEVISGKTGNGVVEDVFASKEFRAHDRAGDGGVGGAGENGDEPEAGQQIDGSAGESGDRIAEGSSDEEEGGDFPAFKSRAERNGCK